MKKVFFVLLLLGVTQVHAVPIVSFNLSQSNIQVGQSFTVNVLASGVDFSDPLLGFGFDINTTSGLTLGKVQVGPNFLDVSLSLSNTDVGALGMTALNGNILLASIDLTAVAAGTFDFGITSDLLNFNQGLLTVLNVYDLSLSQSIMVRRPMPEPFTLALFALGLAGFVRAPARK